MVAVDGVDLPGLDLYKQQSSRHGSCRNPVAAGGGNCLSPSRKIWEVDMESSEGKDFTQKVKA